MNEKDIFQPYEKLIEIEILGVPRMVPENNSLLRCFQFLSMETVSYADLCWNGSCDNCLVWLQKGSRRKAVMSCRTTVKEGMQIVKMAGTIGFS